MTGHCDCCVELAESVELMEVLREKCPWDKKQTHLSLRKYLLEEAYEVLDVLDRLVDESGSVQANHVSEIYEQLEEELGDLWFQILFHAKLADEKGRFSIADVARRLRHKMVERHPHVFEAGGEEPSVETWEKIKQAEKQRSSAFDDIPDALPALLRAEKVVKRANRNGLFIGEADNSGDESELGQALLSLVVTAVEEGKNPELALRSAVDGAIARGRAAETS